MATIQKRRNKGGSTSFVAWVRVKPFKPVARAFKSRAEASAWADDHARELREHRSRGDADADLTRFTLAQLAREYLDDSEVRALGDYATIEQLFRRTGSPIDGKSFERAPLVNFRWHDLRHSCASLLAQNGSNLLEIGSVLGHKSPASTKRYAHLVEHAPVTGHPKLDEKLRSCAQPLEEFAVQ